MRILKPNDEQLNQAVLALSKEARKKLDSIVLKHYADIEARDIKMVQQFNNLLDSKTKEWNDLLQSTAASLKVFIQEEIKEQIQK